MTTTEPDLATARVLEVAGADIVVEALDLAARSREEVARRAALELAEEEAAGQEVGTGAIAIYRMLAEAGVLESTARTIEVASALVVATDNDGRLNRASDDAALGVQLDEVRAELAEAEAQLRQTGTDLADARTRLSELGRERDDAYAQADTATARVALLESKLEPVLIRLGQLEAGETPTAGQPAADTIAELAIGVDPAGEDVTPPAAELEAGAVDVPAMPPPTVEEAAAEATGVDPLTDEELAALSRDDLVAHAKAHPSDAARALRVERAGRNRDSAIAKLEGLIRNTKAGDVGLYVLEGLSAIDLGTLGLVLDGSGPLGIAVDEEVARRAAAVTSPTPPAEEELEQAPPADEPYELGEDLLACSVAELEALRANLDASLPLAVALDAELDRRRTGPDTAGIEELADDVAPTVADRNAALTAAEAALDADGGQLEELDGEPDPDEDPAAGAELVEALEVIGGATLTDEELEDLTTPEVEALASGDTGTIDGRPDSPIAGTGAVPAELVDRARRELTRRRGPDPAEEAALADEASAAADALEAAHGAPADDEPPAVEVDEWPGYDEQ